MKTLEQIKEEMKKVINDDNKRKYSDKTIDTYIKSYKYITDKLFNVTTKDNDKINKKYLKAYKKVDDYLNSIENIENAKTYMNRLYNVFNYAGMDKDILDKYNVIRNRLFDAATVEREEKEFTKDKEELYETLFDKLNQAKEKIEQIKRKSLTDDIIYNTIIFYLYHPAVRPQELINAIICEKCKEHEHTEDYGTASFLCFECKILYNQYSKLGKEHSIENINDKLITVLKKFMKKYNTNRIITRTKDASQPTTINTYGTTFSRYIKKLIGIWIKFNDIRHAYELKELAKGRSPHKIAREMNHSVETQQRDYVKVHQQITKKNLDKIDELNEENKQLKEENKLLNAKYDKLHKIHKEMMEVMKELYKNNNSLKDEYRIMKEENKNMNEKLNKHTELHYNLLQMTIKHIEKYFDAMDELDEIKEENEKLKDEIKELQKNNNTNNNVDVDNKERQKQKIADYYRKKREQEEASIEFIDEDKE